MITNLIFDLGGVILKHKPSVTQDILLEMFPKSQEIVSSIWNQDKQLLNTGNKTSRDFLMEVKDKVDIPLSVNELMDQWKSLYVKKAGNVNWELLSFILSLKEKYRVYLFTDTIDVHDQYNRTRGIYKKFHNVYKSYEEGVAKVEGEKAFIYILKKINAKPSECLFVDDLKSNIEIVKKVGAIGIIYKNNKQLQHELKLLGVA